MRLREQSTVVRNVVPTEYAEVVVFITELGGTTLLMFLLAVLFWCADRRRSAPVISYAVAGLALLLSLKAVFELPRPPADAMLLLLEGESARGTASRAVTRSRRRSSTAGSSRCTIGATTGGPSPV